MGKYIIISLLLVIVLIIIYLLIRDHKYKKYVYDNSLKLKELRTINNKYTFYQIENLNESQIYDNQKFYENISCLDYLIYQLQYKKNKFIEQIKYVDYNTFQYKEYSNELDNLNNDLSLTIPIIKLSEKKVLKVEKTIFEKEILRPCITFNVIVKLQLSKMNGRIYGSKSKTFYKDDIHTIINRLNNKKGTFYNDRGIWEAICRVERGKVSNKLRFLVYERDGWRCRYCGVSNRRAHLEIDHIKPIAKGGKSTLDNLQTLCEKCNKAKGTKYRAY